MHRAGRRSVQRAGDARNESGIEERCVSDRIVGRAQIFRGAVHLRQKSCASLSDPLIGGNRLGFHLEAARMVAQGQLDRARERELLARLQSFQRRSESRSGYSQ